MNRFKTLSKRTGILLGLFIGMVVLEAEEVGGITYLFEGEITKIENSMAPTLREGQVFSGSFVYGENEEKQVAAGEGVYEDVLSQGEFTIDQSYVRVYAGGTGEGLNSIQLSLGDGEKTQLDSYGIMLPVKGPEAGEGGWTARWMQVWLYGEGKKWLKTLEAQSPPDEYLRGWFRLTYWSEKEGKEGICEGPISYFGKEGEPLTPSEEIEMLERVVSDLGTQLNASQEKEAALSASLASARQRIKGMNETLDGLIAEREALKTELRLSQIESGGDEIKAELERLQADEAMWLEERKAMESQHVVLATSLAKSSAERRAMEDELAALREWKEGIVTAVETPTEVEKVEPVRGGGVTIVQVPAGSIKETVRVLGRNRESEPLEEEEAKTEQRKEELVPVKEVVEKPVIEVEPTEVESVNIRRTGPSKFRGRRY